MTSAKQKTDLAPALAFLAPNFLGFVVFTAGPVIFSIVAAFTNWRLKRDTPFDFTGAENFRHMATDHEFWIYFVNTIYLMLGIPFAIAGSLILALLLSQKLRGLVV